MPRLASSLVLSLLAAVGLSSSLMGCAADGSTNSGSLVGSTTEDPASSVLMPAAPPARAAEKPAAEKGNLGVGSSAVDVVTTEAAKSIAIKVTRSIEHLELGTAQPMNKPSEANKIFLALTLEIKNDSNVMVPASFSRFAFRRSVGSTVVTASPATEGLLDPCHDNLLVSPHTTKSCTIAFEVLQGMGGELIADLSEGTPMDVVAPSPAVCNIVTAPSSSVLPVKTRISSDAPYAIEQAAIPNGKYELVRSELFASHDLSTIDVDSEANAELLETDPSTVVIRDSYFQEVSRSKTTNIVSRASGQFEGELGGKLSVECRSPAPALEDPSLLETIAYSKVMGELTIERPYKNEKVEGVLRRTFRRVQ